LSDPITIRTGRGNIVLPGIDCSRATEEIVNGIKIYLDISSGSGIVLGMSGGVDSSLTAALCRKAAGRMYALIMPSGNNHPDDALDAAMMAEALGLKKVNQDELAGEDFAYTTINIQEIADQFRNTFPAAYGGAEGKSVPFENTQSRIRMALLYALKEGNDLRVAGTGNRDEDYGLGYFTKYGDGGVDFSPIACLPKRLVREMAIFNGVPEKIVNRVPTAGLRKGQTDEADLGCSYLQAEIIVEAKDQSADVMAAEVKSLPGNIAEAIKGIDENMVKNVLHRHMKLAPHKLEAPHVIKTRLTYTA